MLINPKIPPQKPPTFPPPSHFHTKIPKNYSSHHLANKSPLYAQINHTT